MTPSAQMSVRASTRLRRRDLLGRHVERRAEQRPTSVVMSVPRPRRTRPVVFEIPKSRTLTRASRPGAGRRKRFAGLRSRWTMPSACASASASHAWSTKSTASLEGQRAAPPGRSPRSSPSRYSITMYGAPSSSVPTSSDARDVLAHDLGPPPAPRARSARPRPRSSRASGRRNLSATRCSSSRCVRADDDPHPADAEDALDAVLAGDDIPFVDRGRAVRLGHGYQCVLSSSLERHDDVRIAGGAGISGRAYRPRLPGVPSTASPLSASAAGPGDPYLKVLCPFASIPSA